MKSKHINKIFFLTFSYYPSGIFKSQIFDVIKLLRQESKKEVTLISFFSFRVYWKCRKWVKKDMPDAIILPIIGLRWWRKHHLVLKLFVRKNDFIIGRNPMGAALALEHTSNVIFDGRSALKGEVEEYRMVGHTKLNKAFIEAERRAILNSIFRMAVSEELVKFWKTEYGYLGDQHVVIPCSLGYSHNQELPKYPITTDRIKLLFSGGGGPWQSYESKKNWIKTVLDQNDLTDLVFLAEKTSMITELMELYPNRVSQKWVEPEMVFSELVKVDYGILLREDNLTNRVAAPVKFAEYLNAGLKVIISDCIVDYANFVRTHKCGLVINSNNKEKISLEKTSQLERFTNRQLADEYFSKHSQQLLKKYREVINQTNFY